MPDIPLFALFERLEGRYIMFDQARNNEADEKGFLNIGGIFPGYRLKVIFGQGKKVINVCNSSLLESKTVGMVSICSTKYFSKYMLQWVEWVIGGMMLASSNHLQGKRQGRTGQDRTGQDRTGQDRTGYLELRLKSFQAGAISRTSLGYN
jgi:hypothetical protein